MKNIEWEMRDGDLHAKMGNVYLNCLLYKTDTGAQSWTADASICHISMFYKTGPIRYSLDKAKADAIRLAEELLVDCHVSIMNELKSCGIEI